MTEAELKRELVLLRERCTASGWSERDRDRYDHLYGKLQDLLRAEIVG